MKRTQNSQSGFTLIEMMMTIGIISGVALLTSNMILQVGASTRNANLQGQLSTLRENFIFAFQDSQTVTAGATSSWSRTLANVTVNPPTTFECLRSTTECRGLGAAFNPVMRDNQPYMGTYMPATNATQGFRSDGTVCNTYVARPDPPDRECWIRVQFRWDPVCFPGAGPCASPGTIPEIDISMNFEVNMPQTVQVPFNIERFNARIRRKGNARPPAPPGACPTGRAIVGFNAQGFAICDDPTP